MQEAEETEGSQRQVAAVTPASGAYDSWDMLHH